MTRKKKTDLDFDFSEMDGEARQSPKEKLKVIKASRPKKSTRKNDDDPILCVPITGGWIDRNITDISPEEFVAWLDIVQPGSRGTPEEFTTRSKRVAAFKYVIQDSVRRNFRDKEHYLTLN